MEFKYKLPLMSCFLATCSLHLLERLVTSAMFELSQETATSQSDVGLCQHGIMSSSGYYGAHACCATSCGQCVEKGCHLLPGGVNQCCTRQIFNNQKECRGTNESGCVVYNASDFVDLVPNHKLTLSGDERGVEHTFRINNAAADSYNHQKVCAVFLTRTLEQCIAHRIYAFVSTSGLSDTWVLTAEVLPSARNHWLSKNGVLIEPQPFVPRALENFGGHRSVKSKPSLIVWILKHPEYSHVWHIEDDVYFMGPWRSIISNARYGNTDVVARFNHRTKLNNQLCKIDDVDCSQLTGIPDTKLKTWWPLLRISHRLATSLFYALLTGRIRGHHEALTGIYCEREKWCKMMNIQNSSENVYGLFTLGGWHTNSMNYECSSRINCTVPIMSKHETDKRFQSKLFHPIKCEIQPDAGRSMLRVSGAVAKCHDIPDCAYGS